MTSHPSLFDPHVYAAASATGNLPITARVHDELRAAILTSAGVLGETQSDAVRRLVLAALRLEDIVEQPATAEAVDALTPADRFNVRARHSAVTANAAARELAEERVAELERSLIDARAERDAAIIGTGEAAERADAATSEARRLRARVAELEAAAPRQVAAALEGRGDTDRRHAPPTLDTVPRRRGTQRERAVTLACRVNRLLGCTVDELVEAEERRTGKRQQVNGWARRMTDVLQAGAVRPATIADALNAGHTPPADSSSFDSLMRPTRMGKAATVYIATPAGLAWLERIHDRNPA